MSKVITINDMNQIKFYQMPKAFFHNPKYMTMKNESKLAYTILKDLLDLSIENNWVNDKNEVFVKLSREKMMKYLQIKGTAKYAAIIKELTDKELIVKRSLGLNRVDETYICIPDNLSEIYSDKQLLDLSEEKNKTENEVFESMEISGGLKIKRPEVRKSNVQRFENQTHINTNLTNTNLTNTNSSSKDEEEINKIMILCQNENIKLSRKKAISFIDVYGYTKLSKAIATTNTTKLSKKVHNDIAYINSILNDMDKVIEKKISIEKKKDRQNYKGKDIETIKAESEELIGWD